jgi:hypothetical protein
MARERPFFSEAPYRCGPGGQYRAFEFRQSCAFEAYEDCFMIDGEVIPYERVLRLEIASNVLGLAYADAAGKRAEQNPEEQTSRERGRLLRERINLLMLASDGTAGFCFWDASTLTFTST